VIEIRNVSKSYATRSGPNLVLDDISFQFPRDENIGILGRNGAGKSTLLRLLAGVEAPDQGEVIRLGRVSWPIGYSGGFNGSLTGEENCRFVARIHGEDIDRVVGFAHEFSEIGDYFYMPVRTYSGGMRARLAFGLSMAVDFNTYLVDEVTAAGDRPFAKKCRQAFVQRQERSSVIIVSHSLSTIGRYCRKCAILKNGGLRMFDTVQEAAEVYEGR
jgi:capsular polysaccharide transport system ATP-binding protein